MNKKGFTLVEMLVVIAIIAVLVAIIVPTAIGATKKASAAADAANLRSTLAEINIWYLSDNNTTLTAGDVTSSVTGSNGIAKPVAKTSGAGDFKCTFDGRNFTVSFGNHTIDDFAKLADGRSNTLASSLSN